MFGRRVKDGVAMATDAYRLTLLRSRDDVIHRKACSHCTESGCRCHEAQSTSSPCARSVLPEREEGAAYGSSALKDSRENSRCVPAHRSARIGSFVVCVVD